MFNKLLSREKGQGLVEYALILVLVAVVVIAVLMLLGPQINQAFCRVANVLKPGTCGVITTVSVSTSGGMSSNVTITVTVSEPAQITVTVNGSSQGPTSCTPSSCPAFTFSGSSGTYTVTADDGSSVSGSF